MWLTGAGSGGRGGSPGLGGGAAAFWIMAGSVGELGRGQHTVVPRRLARGAAWLDPGGAAKGRPLKAVGECVGGVVGKLAPVTC